MSPPGSSPAAPPPCQLPCAQAPCPAQPPGAFCRRPSAGRCPVPPRPTLSAASQLAPGGTLCSGPGTGTLLASAHPAQGTPLPAKVLVWRKALTWESARQVSSATRVGIRKPSKMAPERQRRTTAASSPQKPTRKRRQGWVPIDRGYSGDSWVGSTRWAQGPKGSLVPATSQPQPGITSAKSCVSCWMSSELCSSCSILRVTTPAGARGHMVGVVLTSNRLPRARPAGHPWSHLCSRRSAPGSLPVPGTLSPGPPGRSPATHLPMSAGTGHVVPISTS